MPPETVPVTNFSFISPDTSYPDFAGINRGTFFRFVSGTNAVFIKLTETSAACITTGVIMSVSSVLPVPVRVCRKVTVEG